jgi:hypothetical protein
VCVRTLERSDVGLSWVVALAFDGATGAAEAEIALIAVRAAQGAYGKDTVEDVLPESLSSGLVELLTTTVGTTCGPIQGQHGAVLFLAWRAKLYTTPRKKISASKWSKLRLSSQRQVA